MAIKIRVQMSDRAKEFNILDHLGEVNASIDQGTQFIAGTQSRSFEALVEGTEQLFLAAKEYCKIEKELNSEAFDGLPKPATHLFSVYSALVDTNPTYISFLERKFSPQPRDITLGNAAEYLCAVALGSVVYNSEHAELNYWFPSGNTWFGGQLSIIARALNTAELNGVSAERVSDIVKNIDAIGVPGFTTSTINKERAELRATAQRRQALRIVAATKQV